MESLAKAARSFRNALLVIGGFSLVATLLQLTIPLYMLQIYDRVLPSNSNDTLIFLSVLAAFALIVLGITETVRQILGNRASAKFDTFLSSDVLEHAIREGHTTGGSIQKLKDLQTVRNLIGSKILIGLIDFPLSSIFVICMYFIHPNLFWLTLAGAGILMMVAIFNRSVAEKSTTTQSSFSTAAGREAEFFARNADSIVAMGMLKNVSDSWGEKNAKSLIASDKSSVINATFSGFSRTIRFGLQAAILGYGAYLVQQGEMTAGMIFASSILSGRALQPIDMVINSWPQISAGKESWMRVKDYINDMPARQTVTQVEITQGDLKVSNVLVPNPLNAKNPPLLNRVSFDLPAGKSVAVVGASGSGKSTMARVIVGARKPFSGDVRLDQHNIYNWDQDKMGQHVGYLAQDVELLPGTIAQNIARFNTEVDDAAIRHAAAMAHCDDLIRKMPKGFDTVIGPYGLAISGGEKQRIGLARAFFGQPKLLVLDEPNSSLDHAGEAALLNALKAARKEGITVVLITQRENVLKHVDRIMHMQGGSVADYVSREDFFRLQQERANKLKEQHQKAAAMKLKALQPSGENTKGGA